MENAELNRVSTLLEKAYSPEEVFGTLEGTQLEKLTAARKVYVHIARVVHPDTQEGAENVLLADKAFKALARLWEQAQVKIGNATYGRVGSTGAFTAFTIQTVHHRYTIETLLTRGDLCNLYVGTATSATGTKRVLVKVPVKPQDNDLAANEALMLRHMQAGENYAKGRHFVSQLVDAFPYEERATGILRQITVLEYVEGLFSLKEVREAYPHGIDPKDMSWMWRRLLIALDVAHTNKVIHGCVLPTHVLIQPEQHGVVLIDWSYAVRDPAATHAWISALSTTYQAWYPAEVLAREVPQPGLDIFMAASCMIELLGGDPQRRSMPEHVPWQIQNHLKGCTLPLAHQRPQDARALLKEFDALLARLWGSRKFHIFSMEKRKD
jgi:hypothetical protein